MNVLPNAPLWLVLPYRSYGHVLRAGRSHVVLNVLVEDRPGGRAEVRHHELADEIARIGESLPVLAGRRIEQDARVLSRPGGEDDDRCGLELLLLLPVVVFDAAGAIAFRVREHARDSAPWPHFCAGLSRVAQVRDERIGQRACRTPDMAPAVVDAGRPAFERHRVHPHRCRDQPDAGLLASLHPDIAVAEGLHRRHRVGLALRPPFLLGRGIAGHADVLGHLVVIRRDGLVGDRPVEPAIVLALDREVVGQQAREVGEVVQRGAAGAPTRLIGVRKRVLAFEDERRPGRLEPASPEIRADEIGELPIRPLLEDHDFPSSSGESRGIHRARGTCADDDDIDLFEPGHPHHLCFGAMCGMYGMPRAA